MIPDGNVSISPGLSRYTTHEKGTLFTLLILQAKYTTSFRLRTVIQHLFSILVCPVFLVRRSAFTSSSPPVLTRTPPPPQIAFQGVPHYHTLEARDRFGNLLNTYIDDGFRVHLVGTTDSRANVTGNKTLMIEAVVTDETDAHGDVLAMFTPDMAGSYVMSNEYMGPGGLLATFYRTKDFTDPVLQNMAHVVEVRCSCCSDSADRLYLSCWLEYIWPMCRCNCLLIVR